MKSGGREQGQLFSKPFLIVLLSISLLANAILFTQLKYPGVIKRFQLKFVSTPKVLPSDHIRGNPNAKYTVIEYADFQCSFCSQFHGVMNQLVGEADVKWVYRHFPLPSHELAQRAAEAAECAGDQEQFWEYSDGLFALQTNLTDETFFQLARKLRLDGLSFGICLNTGKYSSIVTGQLQDAVNKKIQGTPTFYVNGKRFDGFVPLNELRKMLAVKKKG